MSERYEKGMAMRRKVLGDAHVDRAVEATSQRDADFQRWITESVWGDLWSSPLLDLRSRSLVTISILAALGHDELELHLRAARRIGVPSSDISQALLHVGAYAGVPAANHAFAMWKRIDSEHDDG